MLERKWLGDKTGQGFYKKEKGSRRKRASPRPRLEHPRISPLGTRQIPRARDGQERRTAPRAPPHAARRRSAQKTKPPRFHWQVLPELWNYAANRVPAKSSDDLVDIDRAMRTGFNWELGPFEMWDAAGVPDTVAKHARRRPARPPPTSKSSSPQPDNHHLVPRRPLRPLRPPVFDIAHRSPTNPSTSRRHRLRPTSQKGPRRRPQKCRRLPHRPRRRHRLHRAPLQDERPRRRHRQLRHPDPQPRQRRCLRNFRGFVISGDAANFSVGANLMQLLLAIQEEEWDEIDLAIRAFQRMTAGHQVLPAPRRRRALRPLPRRRHRNHPPRRCPPARTPSSTWASSKPASASSPAAAAARK